MKANVPIVVLLGLACLGPVTAQNRSGQTEISHQAPQQYVHTVWTTENGLPQNSVTAIIQTRDGYLWLGTFGGLVRFDGVRFTVFDTANAPGLKSNRILALYEDREGQLWIITEQHELTRYAQGVFTAFTPKDGLPDEPVQFVAEHRAGALIAGTRERLVRWEGGRFINYPLPMPLPPGFRLEQIGRDGSVWFRSERSLMRVHGGRHTAYTSSRGRIEFISNIFEAPDGSAWVATTQELLRFHDGAVTAVLTNLRADYVSGTGDLILKIFQDTDEQVSFLTPNGIARVRDGKLITHPIAGLSQVTKVKPVLLDREGTLWVGSTGNGLHRFAPTPVAAYGQEHGLTNGEFVPIIGDDQDGLWLGATSRGLFRFQAGTFTLVSSRFGPWALCRDRQGALWIGSYGGLDRFKDGHLTSYTAANSPLKGLPVAALYEDRWGVLWIGLGTDGETAGGLYWLQDGVFTPHPAFVHRDVRFITEGRQGALWIGTTSGLSRLKDDSVTTWTTDQGLSHNYVRAVYEDADGTVWIGTYGGGLNRFKDGRFAPITTQRGLFDNIVSRILEDDQGNLWMSGNRGVYRASRRDLNAVADGRARSVTCIAYGTADGMKSSECNGGGQPAGWKAADGTLWFPTLKGVVALDPTKLNPLPPPVAIERAIINKTTVDLYRPISAPSGRGELEIHYTGLSLAAPEKVRFKYMLEGYDDDWIEAGDRRVAYYTNISPGTYRFRVIACNNDGVWNETGTALEFSLQPHFYQTKVFYGLIAVALALLGRGLHLMRVRHLERRNRELAAQVAERTAEVVEQKNQLARANEQLADSNEQLARANADMLSVFNQWRSGVMTVDADGRVTFLSHTVERLFEQSLAEMVGQPWQHVVPLSDSDKAQLTAMAARPAAQRTKLSFHLRGSEGQRYWMEIEIKDDPRDERRKIFFLYDVSEVYDLRQLLDDKAKFHDLVGESVAMQFVYRQIQDLAKVETTVLVQGATGTGKELVARAIHYLSPRKSKPFIAVNSAGLTESLLASQLFGHRRGAFTGAVADQVGLFEAAHGGTLFLDEIGDMPLSVQTSLLRVLQEKEITRLGETKSRPIDVRVIAATHRELTQEVAEGRFRQDLLYRIRVTQIQLPPLRHRREDIPLLVAWFLGQFRAATDTPVQDVSQEAMQALLGYDWPGNVRELKSAIESAAISCQGSVIQAADLPPHIVGVTAEALAAPDTRSRKKQRVLEALQRSQGNRAAAARFLGVSRATLYLWLKELEIE